MVAINIYEWPYVLPKKWSSSMKESLKILMMMVRMGMKIKMKTKTKKQTICICATPTTHKRISSIPCLQTDPV